MGSISGSAILSRCVRTVSLSTMLSHILRRICCSGVSNSLSTTRARPINSSSLQGGGVDREEEARARSRCSGWSDICWGG
jgi:hypothetical protein